ncbi:Di-copper centre-containing protein [Sporormia fimetaria CBS 119925]|uniref:Di-copper centre-containing protein n=1 Tax=Sporormia fimetaria CBS 119925 TaxID=1340428 RepID=A0A6A6VNE3_9PLEO|nr:Di-copper centre-containing protein [Sporormia fimetaria CBS 119925]
MRFTNSAALCLLAGSLTHAFPAPQETAPELPLPTEASTNIPVALDQLDQLAAFAQQEVEQELEAASKKRGSCNIFNVAVRREWGLLTKAERKAYTDAVLCLQAKPAKWPSTLVPGAKSRFDDWIATHINQTNTIHYTGTFLTWHRYFTWTYEQALRNECGYKGYQPYWNWAATAVSGLEKSPIFDGSAYSMSGNGAKVEGQGNVILGGNGLPEIVLPSGSGGGCVTSGPFKDMKVNLGPVSMQLADGTTVNNPDQYAYNPRCLKRDLTDAINKRFANATSVVRLILENNNIEDFQMQMQGIPGSGDIGVHGGGHYSLGGDPGRDLFTSPGDPNFYLHHGMIDRVWWIWQTLSKRTRTSSAGISGTGTFLNQPPSPPTTLDTPISMDYAFGPDVTVGDLMDTTGGPLCYIYL